MEFVYDKAKAERLLKDRNIDMEEIVDLLSEGRYIQILENTSRPEQNIFVMRYKGYVHAVPFLYDVEGRHIIKTAYPCRKLNKIFGGRK